MRPVLVSALLLATLVPFVPPVSAATHTVSASNFAWTPDELTIAVGDTVTFTLEQGTHDWQRTDAADACDLPCTRTFEEPGTILYVCGFHPSMTGEIVVALAPAVSISTPASGASVQGVATVTGTWSDAGAVSVRLASGGPHANATLHPDGTWSAVLDTMPAGIGATTLLATASNDEGLEAIASIPVVVANAPRLDVAIGALTAQTAATLSNVVTYRVQNEGNVPAADVPVRVEYLYEGTWHLIGERTHALAAGIAEDAAVTWDPAGVNLGRFQVRATAHAAGDVEPEDDWMMAMAAFVTAELDGVALPPP